MRTILVSVLAMGLLGAAAGVDATSALAKAPKGATPPKSPPLPKAVNAVMPLRISDEGTPLQCHRNVDCKIRGRLGVGYRVLVAMVGDDGKQRIALTQSWSSGEVTFRIPKSFPIQGYRVGIVDADLKLLSNEVRAFATRTAAEGEAFCKTSGDVDGDNMASYECGGADCDDKNAGRFAGNAEVCDAANVDEDCDPRTFGFRDSDQDGHGDGRCCNGPSCGSDCDDHRPTVHPNSPEVCNLVDDNCDGLIDDGVQLTTYLDSDKDLYGDPKSTKKACPHTVPRGYVTNDLDCDDTNVQKNPRGGCP